MHATLCGSSPYRKEVVLHLCTTFPVHPRQVPKGTHCGALPLYIHPQDKESGMKLIRLPGSRSRQEKSDRRNDIDKQKAAILDLTDVQARQTSLLTWQGKLDTLIDERIKKSVARMRSP